MNLTLPRRVLIGVSLLSGVLSPAARAQQDAPANNAPTNATAADAPANAPAANAPTANAAVQANLAQSRPLTPEERRQQTEDKLRALMENLGVNGDATQDAIIDYLKQDEIAHASLREAEKRLLAGLRRDVPPERMRDLLDDYRKAVDSDRDNRAIAQRNLDARIGYSLDLKLEAVLWLMGVLGEGASKLPTSALIIAPPTAATPPALAGNGPVYGPLFNPKIGARGEIVGTVTAKGLGDAGEHWLEIRDDSGATERYAALWRADLKAPDPDMEKQLGQTQLGARVRVQWVWQERRRAFKLQPESAAPDTTTPDTAPAPENQ